MVFSVSTSNVRFCNCGLIRKSHQLPVEHSQKGCAYCLLSRLGSCDCICLPDQCILAEYLYSDKHPKQKCLDERMDSVCQREGLACHSHGRACNLT